MTKFDVCKWYYIAQKGKDLALHHADTELYDREFVELTKCPICGKTIVGVSSFYDLTSLECEIVRTWFRS